MIMSPVQLITLFTESKRNKYNKAFNLICLLKTFREMKSPSSDQDTDPYDVTRYCIHCTE